MGARESNRGEDTHLPEISGYRDNPWTAIHRMQGDRQAGQGRKRIRVEAFISLMNSLAAKLTPTHPHAALFLLLYFFLFRQSPTR